MYHVGDYVECVKDFITHKTFLKKGNIYKVVGYVPSSSIGGLDAYTGIVQIEKNELGEFDAFSNNYFKIIKHK
jgi:hypothetical protein